MNFTFNPIEENEIEQVFNIFKEYLRPVIEEALGWDEVFQKNGFTRKLQKNWFYWIYTNDQKSGIVCFKNKENSTHIHLLIIFKKHQGRGLAQAVMEHLLITARNSDMPLTLSCFKNNKPALQLYHKLGFMIDSDDKYFYDFISA